MLLQEDDRQSLAALSEKIGVAVSTINDRIKRLVRSGMITGFHARIAPEAVGLEPARLHHGELEQPEG